MMPWQHGHRERDGTHQRRCSSVHWLLLVSKLQRPGVQVACYALATRGCMWLNMFVAPT